jgi:hypothetical protein
MLLLQVTRMLLAEGCRRHKAAGFRVAVFKRGREPANPPTLPDAVAVLSLRHSNGITCVSAVLVSRPQL